MGIEGTYQSELINFFPNCFNVLLNPLIYSIISYLVVGLGIISTWWMINEL